jgi:hypothetical protein
MVELGTERRESQSFHVFFMSSPSRPGNTTTSLVSSP